MSKERKPLLSDKEVADTFMYSCLIEDAEHGFKSGAAFAINYYERLIDEGKLKIVKQPRRVKDGDWEHVYGPHTDLYAYSVNKDGTVEILPEMMPQLRTD